MEIEIENKIEVQNYLIQQRLIEEEQRRQEEDNEIQKLVKQIIRRRTERGYY